MIESNDKDSGHVERFTDRQMAEQMSSFVALFGNALRLRLLCRLVCGGQRRSVNELSEWVDAGQSAVSHQLKMLWTARLVDREKEGTKVYYSVSDPAVVDTMQFLASLADRVSQPRGWGLQAD